MAINGTANFNKILTDFSFKLIGYIKSVLTHKNEKTIWDGIKKHKQRPASQSRRLWLAGRCFAKLERDQRGAAENSARNRTR